MSFHAEGMGDFIKELSQWAQRVEPGHVAKVTQAAGDALAEDVRALPAPRSSLGGAHTHLLDTVTWEPGEHGDTLIGWGRYYGRMVESGTRNMQAQPHLLPTWKKNERKYLAIMRDEFQRRK